MAQMLTPLDYATSSNVWAQDGKWKGTFKVRWIYVKISPTTSCATYVSRTRPSVSGDAVARHAGVDAGSREGGVADHVRVRAKTSLLQDFNFYEMQGRPGVSPPAMRLRDPGRAAARRLGWEGCR